MKYLRQVRLVTPAFLPSPMSVCLSACLPLSPSPHSSQWNVCTPGQTLQTITGVKGDYFLSKCNILSSPSINHSSCYIFSLHIYFFHYIPLLALSPSLIADFPLYLRQKLTLETPWRKLTGWLTWLADTWWLTKVRS